VLREAMRDLLPREIGDRVKQPYRAPDAQSFVTPDAPGYVSECMSGAALRATGCFDPKAVEKLVAKSRAGRATGFRDNVAFVGILSTQLWHRAFAPAQALPSSIPAAVA
jgi:asparagine synthase (glutamine-hydrolysing)